MTQLGGFFFRKIKIFFIENILIFKYFSLRIFFSSEIFFSKKKRIPQYALTPLLSSA
jgi:hypothetical protein